MSIMVELEVVVFVYICLKMMSSRLCVLYLLSCLSYYFSPFFL